MIVCRGKLALTKIASLRFLAKKSQRQNRITPSVVFAGGRITGGKRGGRLFLAKTGHYSSCHPINFTRQLTLGPRRGPGTRAPLPLLVEGPGSEVPGEMEQRGTTTGVVMAMGETCRGWVTVGTLGTVGTVERVLRGDGRVGVTDTVVL